MTFGINRPRQVILNLGQCNRASTRYQQFPSLQQNGVYGFRRHATCEQGRFLTVSDSASSCVTPFSKQAFALHESIKRRNLLKEKNKLQWGAVNDRTKAVCLHYIVFRISTCDNCYFHSRCRRKSCRYFKTYCYVAPSCRLLHPLVLTSTIAPAQSKQQAYANLRRQS